MSLRSGSIWVLAIFVLLFIGSESSMAQTKRITVALAQIFTLDGDRAGNLHRIEDAIREAKAGGAELVAFPESSILGWVNPEAHQRAHAIPGPDADQLCQWARQYGVYLCVGMDEKDGDKLFDTALLISDDGTILHKHRKINVLPELMTPPYSVGADVKTVKTRFGTIGLLICADSFQEDLLQRMKEHQPDLVIVPYGWAADESEWPQHGKELEDVVVHAARTIGCPVVGTDVVGQISGGPWRGKVYGGQSVAADATGRVLVRGKDRDRDIRIITISLKH